MKNNLSSKGFTDPNITRIESFLNENIDSSTDKNKEPSFAAIEISINGACTRRCVFCPRFNESKYPNLLTSLDIKVYKLMIKSLKENNFKGSIQFSGFCEPLLTKNINEYLSIASSQLDSINIDIVTNSDCFPKEKVKAKKYIDDLFNAGLTKLLVSIYDGKERYLYLKRFFSELGYLNNKVILRKRYLGPDENFGMTLSNRAGSINIEELGASYSGAKELPINEACYYPFFKMIIDYNGDVLLCSHDWDKDRILGNINENDIYEIWRNEKIMKIRTMLALKKRSCFPCSKCDVEGTLNGEQYFKAWKSFL